MNGVTKVVRNALTIATAFILLASTQQAFAGSVRTSIGECYTIDGEVYCSGPYIEGGDCVIINAQYYCKRS